MNPGRLVTLVAVWLSRSLLGWLASLPFVASVAASGVDALYAGDRALFEPGGLFLAELGRASGPLLRATLSTTWPFLLLALALRTLPHGALFHHALVPTSRARAAFGAAAGRFVPLVTVALAELAAKLLLVIVVFLVERLLTEGHTEALRRAALLLCAGLLGAGLVGVGVVSDVRRALLFSEPELRGVAASATSDHLRAHALPLAGAYLLRSGLGVLAIAVAARLVELVDVGRPGSWRVLAVLLVHQATLALLTVLDARWVRRVVLPLQPPTSFL